MRDVEIPNWLNGLPLAPEFHPTDTEFADPIAYISKIEKEASVFGICKVIPPLPKPSKTYVFSNLNKSLSKCPELGLDVKLSGVSSLSKTGSEDKGNDGEFRAVFTTRHQELGQSEKRKKGALHSQSPAVHKQVWQTGEIYTLEQFESKSKSFARSHLRMVKDVSPLVIEALFWKAASEKPIYVEYANDVPGSGFGEPEGPFRRFHRRRRRRRRRAFYRNGQGSSDCKKDQEPMSNKDENNRASTKCDPSSSEISKASSCSPDMLSNQTSRFSRQKSSNAGNEMEGTSGWKLSNSPWNLQVIARSPGSLTRFMPDDIPGVTSPMVYIGMLFSWFAWHVEDHELHSLNFLHTGSPKTWYAVPGDYAFTFEEVIRAQAYGGNTDRLAALTLLGEKTTLLSPEVVVGSGIPCCRLVQNPGEFVVTFPRAYHVGFSHGFNCGEAANFGTPKWLAVAKEAAVRRAAMNYLPMLSHQQLLYLLTMSFISRVPRSLLPGVRSSRLRDRQKEEREILVKKAFIEDILNENKMLTILLRKNSSFHAVLWDLESLPSSIKESDLCCSSIANIATTPIEDVYPENDNNQDLFSQMSLYMETVNGSYVDDDDLSYGFQIDSGTLPCVACGVLGFPFMSVVQPSEKLKMNLLPADHHMVHDIGVLNLVESHSPTDLNGMVEDSISDGLNNHDKTLKDEISSAGKWQTKTPNSRREFNLTKDTAQSYMDANSFSSDAADKMKPNESNLVPHPNGSSSSAASGQSMSSLAEDQSLMPDFSLPPKDHHDSSKVKFDIVGNTSSGYLRPRIFCLEHAIQIEELLHSKGGADVLVICHSDFQKIKAHAAAIAEEIGTPFNYNEISLDNASQEDLNLINLAIDDEEQDECGEDWTSKLNINLRHCVKLRKKFPSENGQHALMLEGLLSDTAPSSSTLSLKWQSRKSRSKRNVNHPDHSKPSESIQTEKDEVLGVKPGGHMARKEERIIQYSRRSFKSNPRGSAGASKASGGPRKLLPIELSAAGCADPDKNSSNTTETNFSKTKNTGSSSSGLGVLASIEKSELQDENQGLVTTRYLGENTALSQTADSLVAATPVFENVNAQIENVNAQIGNDMLKEMVMKDKACVSTLNDSQMQPELKVAEESSDKNERFAASLAVCVESTENIEIERENQTAEEISVTNETCDMVNADDLVGICIIQSNGAVLLKEGSDPAKSGGSCADNPAVGSFDEQMEKTDVEKSCMNREVYDCVNLDTRMQQEIQTTSGSNENKPVSSDVTLINNSTLISLEESLEVPSETGAAEDMHSGDQTCSSPGKRELYSTNSSVQLRSTSRNGSKRKREVELQTEDRFGLHGFIKSPCEGLRPRAGKDAARVIDRKRTIEEPAMKKVRNPSNGLIRRKDKKENRKESHRCDLESCRMSFQTKAELLLHKRNRCPHEGCGKKFSSHKYATLHLRVHVDDRPLKCPWKGCTMSFKWAWARTEHLRVHTGERPYQCKVEGCGLTFRFVSDFSRHRRKTGHYVNLPT